MPKHSHNATTQPPVAVRTAQAELEARHSVRDSSDSAARTKDQRGGCDLASIKVKGIPGTIVSGLITLLAVVIWIFVITRKGKSTNANMTT